MLSHTFSGVRFFNSAIPLAYSMRAVMTFFLVCWCLISLRKYYGEIAIGQQVKKRANLDRGWGIVLSGGII